jgi:hypothetical protein
VSGWTECAALLFREQSLVVQAVMALEQRLLIALLGLETDNGSELINQSLIDFYCDTPIRLTRSRAYPNNDPCFVEQKNGSVVRRWIGYDRYEGLEACTLLAQRYERLRRYLNYFQPSVKLLSKTRTGAKVSKRYDKAQTPCQRLLASPHVEEVAKTALRAEFERLDPVALQAEIRALQDALWTFARPERSPYKRLLTASPTDPSAEQPQTPQAVVLRLRRDAAADTSPRPTGRQYRRRKTPRAPRTWRTRTDPFAEVWDELQSQWVQTPERTAKALFEYLQRHYPGRYHQGQLRTLQRRVTAWRAQQAAQLLTPQPCEQNNRTESPCHRCV